MAGGTLALWTCCAGLHNALDEMKHALNAEDPAYQIPALGNNSKSVLSPVESVDWAPRPFTHLAVIALAPVADLCEAHARRCGDNWTLGNT